MDGKEYLSRLKIVVDELRTRNQEAFKLINGFYTDLQPLAGQETVSSENLPRYDRTQSKVKRGHGRSYEAYWTLHRLLVSTEEPIELAKTLDRRFEEDHALWKNQYATLRGRPPRGDK